MNVISIKIFGDKKLFAVETESSKTPGMFKICFRASGKKMGSFTKAGEISFFIKAYETFAANPNDFYLPELDGKTPAQINKYLINDLFTLSRSAKKENLKEYERRKAIHLFFGPQFSNDGSNIILLFKNDEVRFIYKPPKKTTGEEYTVAFPEFVKVFDECIRYLQKASGSLAPK